MMTGESPLLFETTGTGVPQSRSGLSGGSFAKNSRKKPFL
jgi:hypothetical protein